MRFRRALHLPGYPRPTNWKSGNQHQRPHDSPICRTNWTGFHGTSDSQSDVRFAVGWRWTWDMRARTVTSSAGHASTVWSPRGGPTRVRLVAADSTMMTICRRWCGYCGGCTPICPCRVLTGRPVAGSSKKCRTSIGTSRNANTHRSRHGPSRHCGPTTIAEIFYCFGFFFYYFIDIYSKNGIYVMVFTYLQNSVIITISFFKKILILGITI